MTRRDDANVRAVLGPTNTGKTHLAIERLCAHSSGIMGFPLRLLAREVYDRVVAIKGPKEVALVTGEEKIVPAGARWLLCTAEAMPVDRDCAFVAIDEAQLGASPERGHIFTDRMLNVRGREETMILGSEALRPIVRALIPKAEIIGRPRFSTLSYSGPMKLSRLPKRSAIVAFSAEEVYAVAEMLRRARGGAAVVMGALSPRTRNAQVAMFQSGEVDYIVATDAIGMGLNMDIAHVAFASLNKFDGRQNRRLTTSEMAQIAGRAGRHQRDGSFGSVGGGNLEALNAIRPEESEAIEGHHFPRLDHVFWRNSDLDVSSLDLLIESLSLRPGHPALRAAPEAIDLSILKLLADDPAVRDRCRTPAGVQRLWAACSLPDFRKVGPEHHARTVQRVFRHLGEGSGTVPHQWLADEIARLDRVDGDIDTLGGRIAAARTWAYIAHRRDWTDDAPHWSARTEALETRLSDALHQRLTERFVDRRTTVLLRAMGNDPALLDVAIDDDGTIQVEGATIGRLEGFAFSVTPGTQTGERKQLLAAAERYLPRERSSRAQQLASDPDSSFTLTGAGALCWRGHPVALVERGKSLVEPKLRIDRALGALTPADRDAAQARLTGWLGDRLKRTLRPLLAMRATATAPDVPPRVRALLVSLLAEGGVIDRGEVTPQLAALEGNDRMVLKRAGLTIGALDVFDARLLKPEALRLVAILRRVMGHETQTVPTPGSTVFRTSQPVRGYRVFDGVAVRIDLVERVARALHDCRAASASFLPDPSVARSFGIDPVTFEAILHACGFRRAGEGLWSWKSRAGRSRPKPVAATPAFAALAQWTGVR